MNGEWAASGSLKLQQLNRLEVDFLTALDWDLHVKASQFFQKLSVIERLVTLRQTRQRGTTGYTYNELVALQGCLEWPQVMEHMCSIVGVTLVTYGVVLVAVMSASVFASLLLTTHASRHQTSVPSLVTVSLNRSSDYRSPSIAPPSLLPTNDPLSCPFAKLTVHARFLERLRE